LSGVKEIMEDYKKAEEQKKNPGRIAVVRVRGGVGAESSVKSTLNMLCIHRKNYCSVYAATPGITGMVTKVKDYVTWGEIDDATFKELMDKRAEKDPRDPKKTKKFFRLSPPRGGFERKGIKTTFQNGGALGYRGKKINGLIKRMI